MISKTKIISEFLGTAFLLMIVVGSGIMGENLAEGNLAVALLANSVATGAGLFVLIQTLGPISGAHFNPVVSLVEFLSKRLTGIDLFSYMLAQFLGAVAGVVISHYIFELPLLQTSTHERLGSHLALSEFIATFGLLATILLTGRKNSSQTPLAVAAYIVSAYWFTSSTSFANPAVTVARSFTNTFCGIAPSGLLLFIVAQLLGALVAWGVLRKQ